MNSMKGGPNIYRDQKNQKLKLDSSYCSSESYSGPENTVKNGQTGHSRDHLFDGLGPEKTGIKEPEFESSQASESGGTDSCPACFGEGCRWCRPSGQAEPEFDGLII